MWAQGAVSETQLTAGSEPAQAAPRSVGGRGTAGWAGTRQGASGLDAKEEQGGAEGQRRECRWREERKEGRRGEEAGEKERGAGR